MSPGKRRPAHRGVAPRREAGHARRVTPGGRRAVAVAGLLVIGLVLVLAGLFGRPAAAAGSDQPIRFAVNDWTGQRISTRLMGAILSRAGFRVEFVDVNYMDQLEQIAAGRIDVAMEFWSTAGMAALEEAVAGGEVRLFGETGMIAREEWWYPSYVVERCPGLPDWRSLKACASVFAVPETAPKGRYLGGPVTWGGFDEERVEALGLDFEVLHADTEADLYASLQAAVAKRQPVMLWIYAPHWAPTRFDGEWVAFPPFFEECYADRRYDCGKPSGPIWKVGAADLPERWPEAAGAIEAFRISNDEMGALIGRVEVDGADMDAVIDEWMVRNEALWKSWLD